jgi:hypothetical protein
MLLFQVSFFSVNVQWNYNPSPFTKGLGGHNAAHCDKKSIKRIPPAGLAATRVLTEKEREKS